MYFWVQQVDNNQINQKAYSFSSDPIEPSGQSDYSINKEQAQKWIQAHPPMYRDALRNLLAKIEFVSYGSFKSKLEICVREFNNCLNKLNDKDFTLLVEPFKSNQWVAEIARGFFERQPTSIWRLGIKNAEEYVKLLDVVVAQKEQSTLPSKVVLLDDASYSGEQISKHVEAIFKKAKEISCDKHRPTFPHVFVIIPFMTKYAHDRLIQVAEKIHCTQKLHIFHNQEMATVATALPKQFVKLLDEGWWSKEERGSEKRSLTYFEHKIPNENSFPPIERGTVCVKNPEESPRRHLEANKSKYSVLPAIIPPYKQRSNSAA